MREFTLNLGETLVIGDQIRLRPFDKVGNQIHLGIEAPKDIPIDREELLPAKAVRPTEKVPG